MPGLEYEEPVEPLQTLKGLDKRLDIFPDHVEIRPRGLWHLLRPQPAVSFALREITDIEWFDAGFLWNGLLKLRLRSKNNAPILILYPRYLQHAAERVRDLLDSLIGNRDILPYVTA
jgi:hypothetical protein